MNLPAIARDLKAHKGLLRKKGIGNILCQLQGTSDFGQTVVGLGDDAAVIRDNGSYLLLAADGIWKHFLSLDPYAAGRASVIVNINDIVATGGKPIAMVNVISCPKGYDMATMLEGIADACNLYRVPMVGGHFHPDADSVELSVAILGRASKLLTSHTAKAGQDILVAMDLCGRRGERFVNSWDATLNRTTEELWERLDTIVHMAEEGLCDTAKDISNSGIVGSIATLLFTSGKGAEINLENIPKPDAISLDDWLKIHPSCGFVLCVEKRNSERCMALFTEGGIAAQVVGEVRDETRVTLACAGQTELLFDFHEESLY